MTIIVCFHLEEEKEGQLLNVVLIEKPVITENIAIVPGLLDEGGFDFT